MGVSAVESVRVDRAAIERARTLRRYAWAALPLLAAVYYGLLMSRLPPLVRITALEIVYCTMSKSRTTVTWCRSRAPLCTRKASSTISRRATVSWTPKIRA